MNELEHSIFSKALENAYRSLLLGDGQALSCIEHMVFLNRALADGPQHHWPLKSELALISRVCAACWPERTLELRPGEGLPLSMQLRRRALFTPVCALLLEAAGQGVFPEALALEPCGGGLRYRLLGSGSVWQQGVITDA